MRISKGERIFNVFNIIFMILLCIVMVYPYLNQIAVAFNEGMDTAFGGITIFPRKFTLENFRVILGNKSVMGSLPVTLFAVVAGTILTLLVTTGAAYAISRETLPFRNFFIWFLLVPSYISAGMIPTYILYRYIGMLNNIWVYVLPVCFAFYYLIIIRTFISGLPKALEEAALIDGANEIIVLFKIILPLSKPVLATVALWVIVAAWNNWTLTLYYVNDKNLYTLQYVIMQLIKQNEVLQQMKAEAQMTGSAVITAMPTSESVKAAAIIVSTIPIVMVYPFLQKYFVKGVMLGAVK